MAADTLRAVASYESHDETANHRHKHFHPAEMIARGGDQGSTPALEEKQIGEKPDQPQQGEGNEGAEYANDNRQQGDGDYIMAGGEVAEPLRSITAFAAAQHKRGSFSDVHFDWVLPVRGLLLTLC